MKDFRQFRVFLKEGAQVRFKILIKTQQIFFTFLPEFFRFLANVLKDGLVYIFTLLEAIAHSDDIRLMDIEYRDKVN